MMLLLLVFLLSGTAVGAAAPYELDAPPHRYSQRELRDPFTRLKAKLDDGTVALDQSGELAFLKSLLKALEVPVESQLLVFSTTSLQLSLISPSNPRALYFNEEVYVGYIPGGKIEVIALDPDLGGIFYIFPIPRPGQPVQPERSDRCMNCHSDRETRYVPGLVIKSVVPAPSGGTLDAFRQDETGHQIPYDQRFGGWYVTGQGPLTNHWGNLIGRMHEGEITRLPVQPGQRFDFGKYLVPRSDVLAHLLLEHQAGFVNRVLDATYRTRTLLHSARGQLDAEQEKELELQARDLVRYILFAEEPALPSGGVAGDASLKRAFMAHRRIASNGRSLKDLDLHEHVLGNRCSYMIYSSIFTSLPGEMKRRVYRELAAALRQDDPRYAYLPAEEKQTIRTILKETMPDFAPFL